MGLKNEFLFRQKAFIDGLWCSADDGGVIAVRNPTTVGIIGVVPAMGKVETDRAIKSAESALSE